MTSQNKITTKQNGHKILGVMVANGPDPDKDEIRASDRLLWTREELWSELTRVSMPEVVQALQWLLGASCIEQSRDRYSITAVGREAYEVAKQTNDQTNPEYVFRDEVLTGMTSGGQETKLTRAVLPDRCHHSARGIELESIMEVSWRVADMAQQFGISKEDAESAMANGLIAVCNGWPVGREPHIGLFHQLRTKRDGVRRQHLCKECTKRRRKDRGYS